jgi:hypothetical protein
MEFIKRKGIISYQEKMEVPFPAMGDITGMQSTLVLTHVSKAINEGSLKIRT